MSKKLFVVAFVVMLVVLTACATPTAAPAPTTAPASSAAPSSSAAPASSSAAAKPTTAPASSSAAPASSAATGQKTVIEFWHGLGKPLGDTLEAVVADFNKSQDKYQINAVFKGNYAESMPAAIAAFRAGKAPHIMQVYEVGTGTMINSGGAIKPVFELAKETGLEINPKNYTPAVAGYFSLNGNMMSMPLNSSTMVLWWNKDAFKKAGLDPEKPPKTWPELRTMAKQIVDSKAASCGYSTAWPTWGHLEQLSAMHDVPFATKSNGFGGLDAELKFNGPLQVKHLQLLLDMKKEGSFKYGGRDGSGDNLFDDGTCAILTASSGLRGRFTTNAKFAFGETMLPYYSDVAGAPKNSIIGGASLWVMNSPGRTVEEFKAVAEFFRYISKPENDAAWHMATGYVPITTGGFEKVKASGFYEKNVGADVPYLSLTRSTPTENSMGLRLGNFLEIRVIIYEEMEKALDGQQTAQQALDTAVKRGNEVLRNFEKTFK